MFNGWEKESKFTKRRKKKINMKMRETERKKRKSGVVDGLLRLRLLVGVMNVLL